ncbi:hypothetical protein QBC37DRAFT_286467 [Rhypophila decipiens]|uniref:Uncharacterized protein n=1 Tax=Rhypophila decipiens TaxID=261697 RepID=A0AAN6Y668_9PEZI|nr:hypothetical protein QBC37DRAFT_286467 [Rhypophila decipiens]
MIFISLSVLLLSGVHLIAASPALSTSPVRADCALVDCASGLECVVIKNAASCVKPGTLGPQCGSNPNSRCPLGETCCNPSCGICTPPGKGCIKLLCQEPKPPQGPKCGPTQCAVGETCCNESCGYCAKPGGKGCTKEYCLSGPKCGSTRCAFDETCCKHSCGYCTKPGEACTEEFCMSPSVL